MQYVISHFVNYGMYCAIAKQRYRQEMIINSPRLRLFLSIDPNKSFLGKIHFFRDKIFKKMYESG
jgi:hypothetical protein